MLKHGWEVANEVDVQRTPLYSIVRKQKLLLF